MAITYTSNYNLGKQEDKNDNFSMGVITENMDKIDAALSSHELDTNNPHDVTKVQVGLDNVVNVDTTTTANITDSVDKRFVTDSQKTVLENTSGANTGDETNTTIISKIGYTPENTLNKGVNNGYCGLDGGGKVPLQNLPSTLLKYIGTWNAETNTPSLTTTDLTKVSNVYVVSNNGTQFGITWKVGDWLIYNADGTAEKSDNSDDVVSVNGKTGIVVVNKADVGLSNVLNIDTSVTTNITDTSLKRFVSDTEKTTWGSKRNTLPEIVQRTTTSVEWRSVAYGNGIFVAVASSGINRIMRSADGITWSSIAFSSSGLRSVAYGNGIFVAVASSGDNRAMRSTDGITWTTVAVEANYWISVAYGNGIFVAVALSGTNRAMWSADGITWTTVAAEVNDWRSVAYGNGIFVAVASAGTNRVMRSTDGITWAAVSVEASEWRSVAYGNGVFVAVGSSGINQAMRSTDGITWTTVAVEANYWISVTYGNGIFVAVALSGTNRAMYSVNAVNWYYKNIPLADWITMGYGDGMFVALALNSSDGLLTIGDRTYSDKSRVVKKSVIGEVSVTIAPADWTGTGPFEKTISIAISGEQITSTTHDIKIIPVWSGTITQKKAAMQAYSYISEGAITSNNTFTLTCYDYKPGVELTLNLEVWRKWL